MPELSPHEIVTTALFLSMLLLLAIASILNGGNARRCIAVLALATGAAASIGIVTRPPGASTWYNGGSGATFGRKADDQACRGVPSQRLRPPRHGRELGEIVSDCWVPDLKNVPTDGMPAILAGDCSRRTLKDAA